jgi:hypothetical protein
MAKHQTRRAMIRRHSQTSIQLSITFPEQSPAVPDHQVEEDGQAPDKQGNNMPPLSMSRAQSSTTFSEQGSAVPDHQAGEEGQVPAAQSNGKPPLSASARSLTTPLEQSSVRSVWLMQYISSSRVPTHPAYIPGLVTPPTQAADEVSSPELDSITRNASSASLGRA